MPKKKILYRTYLFCKDSRTEKMRVALAFNAIILGCSILGMVNSAG